MKNEHPEIPFGFYCYSGSRGTQRCPHFGEKEVNGVTLPYCHFLKQGSVPASSGLAPQGLDEQRLIEAWGKDGDSFKVPAEFDLFLLWDQCKECGENDDDMYELSEIPENSVLFSVLTHGIVRGEEMTFPATALLPKDTYKESVAEFLKNLPGVLEKNVGLTQFRTEDPANAE